jgi:hypothetical protein
MVALVVDANETTVYAGTDPSTLQGMTRSTIEGTNYSNISGTLPAGRLALGRTDYSWAQYNNSWAGHNAQFSDAAVFNTALTPSAITNLFLAGVGVQIVGTYDGYGSLTLNWLPGGTLQESDSVTGPYTDVPNATAPWYVYLPSESSPRRFYRIKR